MFMASSMPAAIPLQNRLDEHETCTSPLDSANQSASNQELCMRNQRRFSKRSKMRKKEKDREKQNLENAELELKSMSLEEINVTEEFLDGFDIVSLIKSFFF